MGALAAQDMLEHGGFDTAIRWHLTSNHFPPIPVGLVGAAKRAIRYANRRQWDKRVSLEPFATWRGQKSAPVSEVVKAWHLDTFLDQQEEG